MRNTEYNIVGDTRDYKGCLIMTCGKSEEWAKEVLNRLLTNPKESDKMMIKGHTNLRIEKVDGDGCWWNEGCD
ncbi:MAG: hypothetical protein HFG89_00020 [Dorea sp.]|jgi:hypothetical protein|nr:hypothetical protein [Dorea sp.]